VRTGVGLNIHKARSGREIGRYNTVVICMHALDIVFVALKGMEQMHPENVFIDEVIEHIFDIVFKKQQGVDVFCDRAIVVGGVVVARSNAARAVTADVVSLL
jgi:hypothetical protein